FIKKRLISRIHAAREHELLPDEQAHLVAEAIELVRLVNAAAPDTQQVHVRVARGFEKLSVSLRRDARRKTVRRNPVCSFGEDGHAVDDERKSLAVLVGLLT